MNGSIEIWDVQKQSKARTYSNHATRVGALGWNSYLLTSGSRDRIIYHHDVRSASPYCLQMKGHRQEVCGLEWSPDGKFLASGGNDNQLLIWDRNSERPLWTYDDHQAAVKAIAWSPHQRGLLASGGGTADRSIRFRNTLDGTTKSHIDAGSQVCNLAWSKNVNEIVSTHGYSQNQIVVWKYPTMTPLATLTGHTMRVLYLSVSPDGSNVVTGAGDQTLRFWNVFPAKGGASKQTEQLKGTRVEIR